MDQPISTTPPTLEVSPEDRFPPVKPMALKSVELVLNARKSEYDYRFNLSL